MANVTYRLTRKAGQDVINIYHFTDQKFGRKQADRYVENLKQRLSLLFEREELAQPIESCGSHTYRALYQSHTIYFKRETDGILILRILHQSMDPARHLL
jgi:toxin ParE1/3/4